MDSLQVVILMGMIHSHLEDNWKKLIGIIPTYSDTKNKKIHFFCNILIKEINFKF